MYRHFQISQWDHAKKHSISSFQDNVNQSHCQTLLHTFLNVWNPKDWQHHLMIDTPHLILSRTARRNRKSYNHHKTTAYCLIYIGKYALTACLVDAQSTPPNKSRKHPIISTRHNSYAFMLSLEFCSGIPDDFILCWCEKSQCVLSSSNVFCFNTCAIRRCKLFPHATRANDKCRTIVEEFQLGICYATALQQENKRHSDIIYV